MAVIASRSPEIKLLESPFAMIRNARVDPVALARRQLAEGTACQGKRFSFTTATCFPLVVPNIIAQRCGTGLSSSKAVVSLCARPRIRASDFLV
jgi:hypothetical protein